MKKRFVAKQVGVLSLTAVLAGMPAVNVLAEDVYAQKVESLQKEMLEQAVATETKLNITFETVHGEKVGETVAKTTATGTGDWTFMLGTDYQLPAGYQLATGVEQVTNVAVPFGATAGHTVVVEPVQEAARPTVLTVTFETVYGEKVGETVASTTATGTGDWTFMLGTDYQLPEGYQLATGVEQVTNVAVPFGATAGHTVVVEPVAGAVTETKLNITFETVHGEKVGETVAKTTATGTGDWTFMLGTDYQLSEGYQLATGVEQVTNVAVPFGATAGHTVVVEPVAGEVVETKLNVTFETVYGEKVGEAEAKTTATGADGEAWTFMLGTDFNLPEGYKLAEGVEQVTNIQVPFGATAGHTMIVEKNTETPDKPDPENPEKPDPENPEKPDPENPEKPNPENPEKPDPENPEKPNQDNANKDDGKTQNTDKKTENKAKTPKTGDDLQAAGTFSILGAGALAAIAALLKKRK